MGKENRLAIERMEFAESPRQATGAPDIFEQISMLFVRYIQRDSVERPRFAIAPGKGVEWHVAVYIGEAPPNLARHYERHAIVKSTQVDEVKTTDAITYRAAVSTSASKALVALRDVLREAIKLRLEADRAIYERATGSLASGAVEVVDAPLLPKGDGG